MSLDTNYKISKTGNAYILYDAAIIAEPALQIFDADYHTNKQAQQNYSTTGDASANTGIGRARVVYFTHDDKALVLKHYYRGGAVASLLKDRYLGFSVLKTRAFKEWRLLKKMQQLCMILRPRSLSAPITTRSGFMKSSMAVPSFKNSGLLTTSYSISRFRFLISSSMMALTLSAVPTGTVDLSTTTLYSCCHGLAQLASDFLYKTQVCCIIGSWRGAYSDEVYG